MSDKQGSELGWEGGAPPGLEPMPRAARPGRGGMPSRAPLRPASAGTKSGTRVITDPPIGVAAAQPDVPNVQVAHNGHDTGGVSAPEPKACTREDPAAAQRRVSDGGIGVSGSVRWRNLLAGGSAREVLARIVQGDPLRVRDEVARQLRTDAYLLDADRVHLRSLARCAREAPRYHGHPDFPDWLQVIVARSIDELLREDQEAERSGVHEGHAPLAAFAALARPLGLEPETMRRACVAFNRLPLADRQAFFDLVLTARSLEDLVRESGESATEIARRARRALDAILSTQPSAEQKHEHKTVSGSRPAETELPGTRAPDSQPHGPQLQKQQPHGATSEDIT